MAYWHHPVFSSGYEGDMDRMKVMTDYLYPVRDKVLSHVSLEPGETPLAGAVRDLQTSGLLLAAERTALDGKNRVLLGVLSCLSVVLTRWGPKPQPAPAVRPALP